VHAGLSALLGASPVLVGRCAGTSCGAAIERPAERAGLQVEAALVDGLIADAESRAGGLPLLSAALLELWQRRDGVWLRLATWEATAGVSGAIAR
jgi:hypothetical protein